MADAGYNQTSQGTWVEGDTVLYRGVAAILCRNTTVHVALEGAQEPISLSLGRGGVALLVRGQVFQRDEIQAHSWGAVARELAELKGLPEIRRYWSTLRGAFWAAYVREEQGSRCVYTATDLAGIMPMWIGRSEDGCELLASALWPRSLFPAAAVPTLRQACPRVVHRLAASGWASSAPDPFHGLHAPIASGTSDSSALEALVVQAARRCVAGEAHVGLLFSGGLDSGLLGYLFSSGLLAPCQCTCYTVGFHLEDKKIKNKYAYPEDLLVAEAAAREMNLEWKHHVMDLTEDGLHVVLSGLGSEEAFAGYQRHARACVAGDEATSRDRTLGLAQMWHRDLQRDFILSSLAGVEMRYPFLDADLLDVALHLPAAEILANDAAKQREQVAGAGNPFHQADFVMSVPGASHSPVALLLTSGYHSIQVYCLLTSWRCEISCVVGSANDGGRAAAFARSVRLPLLDMKVSMSGHGYDMESLTDALKAAKEHYGIEGAACGHVCDLDLWGGVAAACDLVGLRAYAPEWGACSEVQSSMRRLVHDGTVLQLTKFPVRQMKFYRRCAASVDLMPPTTQMGATLIANSYAQEKPRLTKGLRKRV
ncbi:unnamed protein product [Symbiodinium sp. CCMP2456]|nr:unnamed protein product [Symbiodinium sp. CCMP2456]